MHSKCLLIPGRRKGIRATSLVPLWCPSLHAQWSSEPMPVSLQGDREGRTFPRHSQSLTLARTLPIFPACSAGLLGKQSSQTQLPMILPSTLRAGHTLQASGRKEAQVCCLGCFPQSHPTGLPFPATLPLHTTVVPWTLGRGPWKKSVT